MMDWEPAEIYDMDVDDSETQAPFSFTDCDVDMAPPGPPSTLGNENEAHRLSSLQYSRLFTPVAGTPCRS